MSNEGERRGSGAKVSDERKCVPTVVSATRPSVGKFGHCFDDNRKRLHPVGKCVQHGGKCCYFLPEADEAPTSNEVRGYTIRICDACMRLEGEMCHEPGCVLIRCTMPEAREIQQSVMLRHDPSGYVALADDDDEIVKLRAWKAQAKRFIEDFRHRFGDTLRIAALLADDQDGGGE